MPWLIPVVMAVGGAVAGSMKDKSSTSYDNASGVTLDPETDLEKQGTKVTGDSLSQLTDMVNAGPGQSAINNANVSNQGLSAMLSDFAQSGGAPNQQDILQAQESAKLQFAPQQVALDQAFGEEKMRANQLAAQLGRPVNDPYIQAQLSKERMNQQSMMGAQQGAFIGQASYQNANSRLGYTSQYTDVQNSLASQAMANRQALLSLGQGVQASERNFRLSTATRWGKGSQETESGGGAKGAITGGIAGFGAGMGAMGGMGGGGAAGKAGGAMGGMGSGGSVPQQSQRMTFSDQEAMPIYATQATTARQMGGVAGRGSGPLVGAGRSHWADSAWPDRRGATGGW